MHTAQAKPLYAKLTLITVPIYFRKRVVLKKLYSCKYEQEYGKPPKNHPPAVVAMLQAEIQTKYVFTMEIP
jgi:hypothetical protein